MHFPKPAWRRRRATASADPTIAGCSSAPGRSRPRSPTRRSASRCRPSARAWSGYGSLADVMAALEAALSERTWLAGDRFTAADVYVGAHVGWGMQFGTLDKRPAFERYAERVSARPAAVRAREIDDALVAEQQSPAPAKLADQIGSGIATPSFDGPGAQRLDDAGIELDPVRQCRALARRAPSPRHAHRRAARRRRAVAIVVGMRRCPIDGPTCHVQSCATTSRKADGARRPRRNRRQATGGIGCRRQA